MYRKPRGEEPHVARDQRSAKVTNTRDNAGEDVHLLLIDNAIRSPATHGGRLVAAVGSGLSRARRATPSDPGRKGPPPLESSNKRTPTTFRVLVRPHGRSDWTLIDATV